MAKLLRITTIYESLQVLLPGQLAFMREQGLEVWAASAAPTFSHSHIIDGCRHFTIPLTRSALTPFTDLLALYKTIQLIQRLRPDIVHTHTPKAGLVGMLAARLLRVPVRIHTVAGLPLMERRGPMRWLLKLIERLTYRLATHVWPNSFGLEAYIRQHLFDGPKLRVIGKGSSNGIDTDYFRPSPALIERGITIRRQLRMPADAFVWVFVGRIVRDKGVAELVKAFRTLAVNQPNTRLVLVGQEEEQNQISQEIRDLIANDANITAVGYQTDVRPYILMANALVLPSYREGLPNVLLQAACLERPVIATDIVGCREVVAQGETGLLLPPKDSVALSQAMILLANDSPACTQMGRAARVHVMNRYDRQRLGAELVSAYQEALTTHRQLCMSS